ncbi:MAG: DUF2520 domain-containing protein [Acidobacteriota bacterium]
MNGKQRLWSNIALVGAGKVGTSLVAWLHAHGAQVAQVATRRSGDGGEQLARRYGARATPLEDFSSAGSDLLLLAVADPALDQVVAGLAQRPQADVALHTAGSRGASALAALRHGTPEIALGSLHPLKAFPTPRPDVADAAGVFFALDGDPPAVALGLELAHLWGGRAAVISEDKRLAYHAAATLAAGGVVTLLAAAADLGRRLGLPAEVAEGYLALARGALDQAETAAPDFERAITGPVARGDEATFRQHLEALAGSAPELKPLLEELAAATRRLRDA